MKIDLTCEQEEEITNERLRDALQFLQKLPKKEREPGDPELIKAFKLVMKFLYA